MENKRLHTPAWKMWILALAILQLFAAIQSFRVHQQMWDSIHNIRALQIQELQKDIEFYQSLNQNLKQILQKLQGHS